MNKTNIIICPICHLPLIKYHSYYKCTKNHSFDISKESYINLLINHKKCISGDNKNMLIARRSFLEKNYYFNISDALNSYIKKEVHQIDTNINVLDIGCGEGHYLGEIESYINKPFVNYYGIDISKDAIKLAAKKHKNISFFVANAINLPFSNNSIDIVISMFSRYSFTEIKRVLKPNGKVIIIKAGKNHLVELKKIIYTNLIEKYKKYILNSDDFKISNIQNIKYNVDIKNNEDIISLLTMTPHFWKAKKSEKEKITNIDNLSVTVHCEFIFLCQN